MLAEHELLKKFSDDEASKQGHIVENIPTIRCWANSVGRYLQAFTKYSSSTQPVFGRLEILWNMLSIVDFS